MDEKKFKLIVVFLSLLICVLFGFFMSYNNMKDSIIEVNTLSDYNNSEVFDSNEFDFYLKSKFNDLSYDEQVKIVDKLYFSTCDQINDFCKIEDNQQLEGCKLCE